MNRKLQLHNSYIAYRVGCKLAELQSIEDLTSALVGLSSATKPDTSSKILSDSEAGRGGDSWGHRIELTLPSNMSVPSR